MGNLTCEKKRSMGWVYSKVAKTRISLYLFVILLFLEISPSALLEHQSVYFPDM